MASKPARASLKTKRKPRGRPVGIDRAIKIISKSGTTISAKASARKRGGARIRGDRTSDSLSLQQCRQVIQSAYASGNVGLPLQRHLTVHWGAYGITGAAAGRATAWLLKLAGDYCRKHGQSFAAVWVRESVSGDDAKSDHTHFLLHVPPATAVQFVRRQRHWLKIVTGQLYRRGSLHTSRIGRHLSIAATNPDLYVANLAAVLEYVTKAASPAAREALGISRPAQYGRVIGKRCGWTENIGATARRRWQASRQVI